MLAYPRDACNPRVCNSGGMDEHTDTPGNITYTPDPLYPTAGTEIRINGRLVGRIRRHTSGRYSGVATISGLSVVGDLTPAGPGSLEMFRRTTRSDAIHLVLRQAREDLAVEAKERRE